MEEMSGLKARWLHTYQLKARTGSEENVTNIGNVSWLKNFLVQT